MVDRLEVPDPLTGPSVETDEAFGAKEVSYIAQHDAYQYFDVEHGIRFVAAVNLAFATAANLAAYPF